MTTGRINQVATSRRRSCLASPAAACSGRSRCKSHHRDGPLLLGSSLLRLRQKAKRARLLLFRPATGRPPRGELPAWGAPPCSDGGPRLFSEAAFAETSLRLCETRRLKFYHTCPLFFQDSRQLSRGAGVVLSPSPNDPHSMGPMASFFLAQCAFRVFAVADPD